MLPSKWRYVALKQQLRAAPEPAKLVKRIKSKTFINLDTFLRSGGQEGGSSQDERACLSSPAHAAFAQAKKQGQLLGVASEAVMGNCEPRVRAAAPQFGGTKRLMSTADLESTELGRYALEALQRLLLVPRGGLPPDAHIICEVALPLQQDLCSSPPEQQPVTLTSRPSSR